ncbi:MAG: hypothetical protein K2P70_07790 [Hyphomonadaceae bacterium]|jgi:hypothetical protein|nr:hypothetical protein [Hyphomonadaceae bacterium]
MSHHPRDEEVAAQHLAQSGNAHRHLTTEEAFESFLRSVFSGAGMTAGSMAFRSLHRALKMRFRVP